MVWGVGVLVTLGGGLSVLNRLGRVPRQPRYRDVFLGKPPSLQLTVLQLLKPSSLFTSFLNFFHVKTTTVEVSC